MARREKERYTERARPNRQTSKSGGSGGDGGEQAVDSTALVYIAAGALVVALALLLGMFVMRSRNPTAAAPTPAPTEAAAAPTDASAALAETDAAATAMAAAAITDTGAAGAAGAKKSFAGPEDQKLDPANKAYFATIETGRGPIVVELFPDVAPKHVNSFIFLARQGFYDGLTFHRVEPGFVVQGGDPDGNGSGGPGYSVPGEFNTANPVPHRIGTFAMARSSDPDSAGSQFYIVTADGPSASSLDGKYTNFGHVVKGMKNALAVQIGDVMQEVTIEEKPKSESIVSADAIRKGELPAND